MNLRKILSRFRQYGGLRLMRQYAGLGALWPMAKDVLRNPFSRKAYKRGYMAALRVVEPFLREKYGPLMRELADGAKAQGCANRGSEPRPRIIWFCWLQGFENAPRIVKACLASIRKNLPDREVKLVDAGNWREYADLPDYIVRRWEKRQIPPALFADLLRLQLLLRYGGTWMDATILCTGSEHTEEYLNADLFMFQYTEPGSSEWRGIGNWFITACPGNPVLQVLRDMLFAYWKDYDCTLDYYIFHLFFSMLREVFPEEIAAMPYGYCMRSLALVHHWGEHFDRERWDRLVSRVSFHKLTYDIKPEVLRNKDSYYQYLIKDF
ncbi:MAG: hypothetical protein IJP39_11170 [Bacteroidales bacterium]|nr:hypothetical protein [Bacteroidales bacterium]